MIGMNREVQVRICEGLGVKLPGPTRHGLPLRLRWHHDRCTSDSCRLSQSEAITTITTKVQTIRAQIGPVATDIPQIIANIPHVTADVRQISGDIRPVAKSQITSEIDSVAAEVDPIATEIRSITANIKSICILPPPDAASAAVMRPASPVESSCQSPDGRLSA